MSTISNMSLKLSNNRKKIWIFLNFSQEISGKIPPSIISELPTMVRHRRWRNASFRWALPKCKVKSGNFEHNRQKLYSNFLYIFLWIKQCVYSICVVLSIKKCIKSLNKVFVSGVQSYQLFKVTRLYLTDSYSDVYNEGKFYDIKRKYFYDLNLKDFERIQE